MSKIKAVLFDFDDTLYSHQLEEIPGSTKRALAKLKENGYLLGLCTSRTPLEFRKFPQDMLAPFDAVVGGTGCYMQVKDRTVYTKTIAPVTVKKILSYLDEQNILYLCMTDAFDQFFNKEPEGHVREHMLAWQGNVPEVKKWSGESLVTIMFYGASELQIRAILELCADSASVSRWGHSGMINEKGIDKGFGLRQFAKYFGLDQSEVAAFGDGANDIEMIDAAGVGVAIGTGNFELQRHANAITKPIEEGGIYDTCVELGWIRSQEGTQIIAFDIDGTLFEHKHDTVPASTLYTLEQLKKNGFILGIDTGRAMEEMKMLPRELFSCMDFVSTTMGTRIDMDGKTYLVPLSEEHCQEGVTYLKNQNIPFRWVDDQGGCYLNNAVPQIEVIFQKLYQMVPEVKPYAGERLIHILYYTRDPEQLETIERIFAGDEHLHLGYANEVTAPGINKASAIARVAAHYGYTIENTAAFGDGDNDIPMLKAAKIGVAMGNGSDACKQAANYVTQDINENGIYEACLQFGWISK